MVDLFQFPMFNASDSKELSAQITDYLIQFKETLEFALMNISAENLSQDLIVQLNNIGANIEKSIEDRDDQIKQVTDKTLSVSDVINSNAFALALENKMKFRVNFENGELEYSANEEM
jgi:hypothetical protein